MSLEEAVKENTAALHEVKSLLMNLGKATAVAAPAPEVKDTVAKKSEPAPLPADANTATTAAASAAPVASASNSAEKPLTYDQVKQTFFDYMKKTSIPAGEKFLKDNGLEHMSKATPEQWPALHAQLKELIAALPAA